jgi:ribosomal protein L14E/L6E/L27E
MDVDFLKERLERFLKIIPAEYKIADPMKKSPKGWTTTLERLGKAPKAGDKPKIIEEEDEKKSAKKEEKAEKKENKSKKKSLDDLLNIEGGLI